MNEKIHSNMCDINNVFVACRNGGSSDGHLPTFLAVMSSRSFVLSLLLFGTRFPLEVGSLLLCLALCSDSGHSSAASLLLSLL